MIKLSSKYVYCIFPVLAILTLVLSIWKAFHGITMHDDAWYLFLLRDGYISASQYNLLFHNIFHGDIAMIKITEVILEIIGSGVFSYGIWHYHKEEKKLAQKDFVCLFSIVYISSSLFCILLTVISYITLIGTIYYMAIGLCFCALSVKSRMIKSVLYIMAGMLCGLSPFVMITTTPMIVVLWGFVFVCENKEFHFYSILIGIVGIVLTCILFFQFCLPLQDYISLVTSKASLAIDGGLDSTHGLKQILLWIYQSITRFYLSEVFVGIMFVIGCYYSLHKLPKKHKLILWVTIGCFAAYYYYTSIWRKGYSVAAVLPFYIFAALCIIGNIQQKERPINTLLYVLLFFTPFFLSMGTDTTLAFRSYWYMGFVLPIIYLSLNKRIDMMKYFVLLVAIYWCTTTIKITKKIGDGLPIRNKRKIFGNLDFLNINM